MIFRSRWTLFFTLRISKWFMVNSLSLNLNKTFHGIKVFRMHRYIIRIMMSCKKKRESCRHLFRKLKILPLPSQYMLSLLLFVINNRNQCTIHSKIHRVYSRQFNNFHQSRYNLSKYQEGLDTHTQNCGNLVICMICWNSGIQFEMC
jgi:hypothetical protein